MIMIGLMVYIAIGIALIEYALRRPVCAEERNQIDEIIVSMPIWGKLILSLLLYCSWPVMVAAGLATYVRSRQ